MTPPSMMPASERSRAWVEVDLGALVANARTVLGRAGSRLLPMVKANGYGLGAVPVARALRAIDPWGFGVASVTEGVELRAAGIDEPIVVFTPLVGAELDACADAGLRPAIGDLDALRRWVARSDRPFHLEIDTGMARSGLRWNDTAALDSARQVVVSAVGWEGIFTHFHSPESDPVATRVQWERFTGVLGAWGRRPLLVHAANSAGALADRAYAADLVRPGIFLYGGRVGADLAAPVATLRAPVVALRHLAPGDTVSYGATWRAEAPTTVATLAAGYADGIFRALTGRGHVEVAGRIVPMLGRVTMDMCMADVTGLPVQLGDVATIWGGTNEGPVALDAQAQAASTISYELLTALSHRVPRRYRNA